MPKTIVTILMIFLFSWNIILGTTGGLVLCLHDSGVGHILTSEKSEVCCHSEDENFEEISTIHSKDHCNECTDLELKSDEQLFLLSKYLQDFKIPNRIIVDLITADSHMNRRVDSLNSINYTSNQYALPDRLAAMRSTVLHI